MIMKQQKLVMKGSEKSSKIEVKKLLPLRDEYMTATDHL